MHGDGEYLETPDGEIYFEVEGAGETVMLVGGGPGNGHAHYHPWFSALARGFRVVYFDYLGTGRSSRVPPRSPYSIEQYAGHMDLLRSHLGVDAVALIGISFGGMPALEYALRHTRRVRRLVLSNAQLSAATWQEGNIDGVNRGMQWHFPERWARILELRARGLTSLDAEYQELYGDLLTHYEWFLPDRHADLRRDEFNALNLDVYSTVVGPDPEWEIAGTMAGFDPVPAMRTLALPTLIVTGRWDRLTPPRIAHMAADALPHGCASLRIFERSAHRPWVEEPDAYFATLAEFLADDASPRGASAT